MTNQNFVGSLECNFVGNCFVASQCRTIHYLLNVGGEVNSWIKVNHKIHED